jgi:hypothetical protein
MSSLQITIVQKALNSFIQDLRENKIAFQFQVRNNLYFLEDSPKLRMAVRMVNERFGSQSILVVELP